MVGKNNGHVRRLVRCALYRELIWRSLCWSNLHDVVTPGDAVALLCPLGQDDQAEAADPRPEKSTQTANKCQGQTYSSSQAEHSYNKHVPALVGSDVSWIERASDIYELG